MSAFISRPLKQAKKQCFFYVAEKRTCNILETDTCKGCRFYKTPKEYADEYERHEAETKAFLERKKAEQ